jgi:hypothetical protein
VLFADEDRAALKCGEELLIGANEAREGQAKGVEGTFQSLHEQDFHEAGEVILRGHFAVGPVALIIGERTITGEGEVAGEALDCEGEGAVLMLIELIEERLGRGHIREAKILRGEVGGVVARDFRARAADHQILQDPLPDFARVLADGGEVFFAVALTVEALESLHQAGEKGFEIAQAGQHGCFAVLEELYLAEDVVRVIVERCGRDENDALAAADLREAFIGLVRLSAETVGFIDEDVVVVFDTLPDKFIELSAGLKSRLRHTEIAKDIRPGAGVVVVEQRWRCDDESASRKLLGEKRSHVGFSKANDIGQEDSSVFVERPAGRDHCVILIFQFLEARREIDQIRFLAATQLRFEILVEEFQVEFVRRELRKGRAQFHSLHVGLGNLDRVSPQLIEFHEREVVVRAVLQLDVEL